MLSWDAEEAISFACLPTSLSVSVSVSWMPPHLPPWIPQKPTVVRGHKDISNDMSIRGKEIYSVSVCKHNCYCTLSMLLFYRAARSSSSIFFFFFSRAAAVHGWTVVSRWNATGDISLSYLINCYSGQRIYLLAVSYQEERTPWTWQKKQKKLVCRMWIRMCLPHNEMSAGRRGASSTALYLIGGRPLLRGSSRVAEAPREDA